MEGADGYRDATSGCAFFLPPLRSFPSELTCLPLLGQVELATGVDTKDVLLIRAFHRPSVPVSEGTLRSLAPPAHVFSKTDVLLESSVLQLAAATFGGPVANLPALSTIAATFLATRDEEDVDIAFVLLGAH